MKKGILYAFIAYVIWGFLPIYWKALPGVSALEILSHRVIWSFLFLMIVLAYKNHWQWITPALRNRRIVLTFCAATMMLGINWLVYIWAVKANHVVESSLGYFINPLVNVLLGVIFLRERLRHRQVIAIGIAALGVIYLTISLGALPWIGLTLALSFGLYGLLRKTAALNSLEGLALETALLVGPALLYVFYQDRMGAGSFGHAKLNISIMLAFAGVITAVPLLLFAAGARRVPLSTLGIIQYIAPTIQFLLGVFLYGEPLTLASLVGFGFIWAALAIYSAEGLLRRRRETLYQYAN
ncbi:MAG: EamA family transporter RarD [Chloroflexi bacterium]|nr:EamA family transporter RarD [Chloroflexota bacterium]